MAGDVAKRLAGWRSRRERFSAWRTLHASTLTSLQVGVFQPSLAPGTGAERSVVLSFFISSKIHCLSTQVAPRPSRGNPPARWVTARPGRPSRLITPASPAPTSTGGQPPVKGTPSIPASSKAGRRRKPGYAAQTQHLPLASVRGFRPALAFGRLPDAFSLEVFFEGNDQLCVFSPSVSLGQSGQRIVQRRRNPGLNRLRRLPSGRSTAPPSVFAGRHGCDHNKGLGPVSARKRT
jgi:hypothetical protein